MLWGCELADAMAQVEDVRGALGAGIGVWSAKGVQHPPGLFGHGLGGCKQSIGVEVALQGFARATHWAAHFGAGGGEVDGPVQPQNIAIELGHLGQPQAPALGEHNARNHSAVVRALEL